MTVTLQPTQDYVLVQPRKADATSKGGIFLPDSSSKPMSEGEILAVGPGRILDNGQVCPVRLDVGAVIMFTQYAGAATGREPDAPVLLREHDVMVVVAADG